MQVTIETPTLSGDALAALEAEWRALEARCDCSFFQSWSWVGCRIAARFDQPRLVRAHHRQTLVGLALFNRRRLPLAPRTLWLHETGNRREDSVFIEHNGPLVARGSEGASRAICQAALRDGGGVVVLSGIGPALAGTVSSLAENHVRSVRPAPFVALASTDAASWRASLGGSTRAQLNRSRRRLGALGPVLWRAAHGLHDVTADLERLASLHQARWTGRGLPGAFSVPEFVRFHRELVRRAYPRGELSIGHLSVDGRAVCYLYEFRWRGSVLAYQSGIDREFSPQTSPGLLAHAYAIEEAMAAGFDRYDFLAGESRYKRSLGNGAVDLAWLELADFWTTRGWPQTALHWSKQKLHSVF